MPAPILAAMGKYFSSDLGVQVWPEEVPRWDVQGNPINPQAAASPSVWPAAQVVIAGKVVRSNTFEDSYSEDVPLVIKAWGTSRAQVDGAMGVIEAALVQAANWAYQNSPIGQMFQVLGYPQFWLYDLEVGQWSSEQQADERLAGNLLCWLAEMDMQVGLHGSISTA